MNLTRLIKSNLIYYLKRNLYLVSGIAISTAVLTGALIVGDSVKYSLNRIVDHRLGQVTHVLKAGDRYFTTGLAGRIGEDIGSQVSPLLLLDAIATSEGGQRRVNQCKILGIDQSFDRMAVTPGFFKDLSGDTVIISSNLANRLGVTKGEEILLRIKKASLVPLNAPFVSDAENIVSTRVLIKAIANDNQLGPFNLNISQTAPFNIFISLDRLNKLMGLDSMANNILFSLAGNSGEEDIRRSVEANFTMADALLRISKSDEFKLFELKSERVFLDDKITDAFTEQSKPATPVLTYFVNAIRYENRATPYSFVSTLPDSWIRQDEIIFNRWLADDLHAGSGDTVVLSYFTVGPLRELSVDSASFVVKSVVPVEGRFDDPDLMPDLPGLSDAGNCRDWETGVPINLDAIRDKDEQYWDKYKGNPKAFISLSKGTELWKNRFGTYTAIRFDASEVSKEDIKNIFHKAIKPWDLGFQLESVRDKGYFAAQHGVDFSQLFGGLSFFLLAAAIILIVLLFLLNLENRREELSTLSGMGIAMRTIRRIVMTEGMMVAIPGSLLGLVLAVVYNKLVFMAMNGVWKDIIRTDMMYVDIRPATLATGFVISIVVSLIVLYFPLNRFLKRNLKVKGTSHSKWRLKISRKILVIIASVSLLGALILIGFQLISGEVVNPAIFFSAGTLLLLFALILSALSLNTGRAKVHNTNFTLNDLSRRNALRNRTRSMSIIILFALGTFVVISTGSNRKDMFSNADDLSSGTGGYLYYAESTVPVLRNLNKQDVRSDYGIEQDIHFVQLRKASGDDASCLNLNKITNPRILGLDPERLKGRFSFVTGTDLLDGNAPWLSLNGEPEGGLIPAIADETVIKWGLGLNVGDTLNYRNSEGREMKLLLVGGLAPSIFQGNVLISDKYFLENFPRSSGTEVFLIEGNAADTAAISSEINRGMRDMGWDMELAAQRLVEFNSVTNTYLSIFMVMGALGLLLGTIGLAIVLARSILERRKEIALLKAVGYSMSGIRRIIFTEYLRLLVIGIGSGFVTAIVATLPSFINPHSGVSFASTLWILLVLLGNGILWIAIISRNVLGKLPINEVLRND